MTSALPAELSPQLWYLGIFKWAVKECLCPHQRGLPIQGPGSQAYVLCVRLLHGVQIWGLLLAQPVSYLLSYRPSLRLGFILNVAGMWKDFNKKIPCSDIHYRMTILDAMGSLDMGAGYKRGSGETSL